MELTLKTVESADDIIAALTAPNPINETHYNIPLFHRLISVKNKYFKLPVGWDTEES